MVHAMRNRMQFILTGTAMLLSQSAVACPLCRSETAKAIRAGLIDENLPISLAATLAPFLLVLGIVGFVHFGGGRSRERR
jgi:hypothetical protein